MAPPLRRTDLSGTGIIDQEMEGSKRTTKREGFLRMMDDIIPWEEWDAYIKPYYPRGEPRRPPIGIETMLRMFLLKC